MVAKIKSCIPRALRQGGQYYQYCPANITVALGLCDQSFNIDLRLRYVVRIHIPYLHRAMAERGSVYTGRAFPRQTGQPHEDCLGEDLGEGQV